MADGTAAPAMRWWGWGDPAHARVLPAHALGYLSERLGALGPARPPVALAHVRLEPSRLSASMRGRLADIVGERHVRSDHGERVAHAAGRGYVDLITLRAGEPLGAPDAVVLPRSHEQLRALLELCSQSSLALVPFGGGTSVVGGVAPLRGSHEAVLALDTRRLCEILELDREAMTVSVQGGLRAPALERHLAPHGLTLGHFPQSYEYVSLGGCAATRSAGQASTGYGTIAGMLLGLRLAAPTADIDLPPLPATAAGPGLRQLLVGSEGSLGVIEQLSLRVRAAPAERVYEGFFFREFSTGAQALRAMAQEHALPDVARLSDEQETQSSLALARSGQLKDRLGETYLALRGYRDGCLAIFGFEGSPQQVRARRRHTLELARSYDGLALGRAPGEAWRRSRFEGPYLRDELLTHGVMVETLETAAQWSRVGTLHREVGDAIEQALRACGTPGLAMCHISHVYESGASLYFTFLARRRQTDELGQWRAVKQAASGAIIAGKGTITHHHAIGRDHAPWLERELGSGGVAALRALKRELDPAGIMNPGKLLAHGSPH